MKTELVALSTLTQNPNNPRVLRGDAFEKLLRSLREFPAMMHARPIVVDENDIILGGNMRAQALEELGVEEIEIFRVSDWSEDQKREFIIKDNVNYGDWDWDALANEWEAINLNEWGLDVWEPAEEPDYSVLEETGVDVDDELKEMTGGVRKSLQIEFEPDEYEAAREVSLKLRKSGIYLGGILLAAMRAEEAKLETPE